MMFQALLFDLDGTLIDTEKYYRRCWPMATEHFGFPMSDAQVLELRSLGRPFAPQKMREWFGEDFDYAAVREYRKQLFEELVRSEGVQLKKGAIELLNYMKENHILAAVATATDVERAGRYLDMVGIRDRFDKICSAADAPEGKPSPYVYLEACAQLGLEPSKCLAVEDAPNGIRAAHGAGVSVVLVPDQREAEPEVEHLCFAKVENLSAIISLLR